MDGDLVLECNDPEKLAFKFGNGAPEPESVRFLLLKADRRLDDPNAQLLGQVRPFCEHLFLEVFGEPVVGHRPRIVQTEPERSKRPAAPLNTESRNPLRCVFRDFFVFCLANVNASPAARQDRQRRLVHAVLARS